MANNKQENKEYIFSNTLTITEETEVFAKTYEEAEEIYLRGGGTTDEVWNSGGNWECINNPDDLEEQDYAQTVISAWIRIKDKLGELE